MARSRHPVAPPNPATRTHFLNGSSHGLTIAVVICGAFAGASLIEVVAALISHSDTPITPDHLVAALLVLLGAIAGGSLAGALVRAEYHVAGGHFTAAQAVVTIAETVPAMPTLWQPTPLVVAAPEAAQPGQVDGVQLRLMPRAYLRRPMRPHRRHTYTRRHHHMRRHATRVSHAHECLRRQANL